MRVKSHYQDNMFIIMFALAKEFDYYFIDTNY